MKKGKWDKNGQYHPSEGEVTNQIRDALSRSGIWHWKHWSGGFTGLAGISDLLGIYETSVDSLVNQNIKTVGIFMALEVKRPGQKPTQAQENFLELVNLHHGIGIWADNVDDVIRQLKLSGRLNPLFSDKGFK